MATVQKRSFSRSDETRTFDKGPLDLVALGGVTFGLGTFQPGWRWSTSVKPLVKTKSCEVPYLQYHVSGRLRVRMDDGSEEEFGPGKPDERVYLHALDQLAATPPEAWMVGDHLEWDVAAPQRLGLTGIWIDLAGHGVPTSSTVTPHRIIRALPELL